MRSITLPGNLEVIKNKVDDDYDAMSNSQGLKKKQNNVE